MPPKTTYSVTDMASAVKDVLKKADTSLNIAKRYGIPTRTLRAHVKQAKNVGDSAVPPKRMGPRPTLPMSIEHDLVTWIADMERDGRAVGQTQILNKANAILARIQGKSASLTKGWFYRFMNRHPVLSRKQVRVGTATARRGAISSRHTQR
ncbi:hypothetical protein AaE_006061 [Aphanomyces astaci]|uniref:HTH CENPB-type domain-containing protein n=1 Tax=Aphanomyces astaci TaxID=112090 RepID=A0A6A5A6A4_APHAT|nr:hypothetical protein AaE_006061 [Aphanomyces astaci]